MIRARRTLTIAAIGLLALANTGCWHFLTGASGYQPSSSGSIGGAALLRVNEAGFYWSNGSFGEVLREALLAQDVFDEIHYPVEPVDPPSVVLEVEAVGHFDEAVTWAFIGATITGFFYFVPMPIVPYFQSYDSECLVRLRDGDRLVGEFGVETRARVTHAIFANPETYVEKVKERTFRDLSARIADELVALSIAAVR
ncbi:MAG: hypothetical protein QNK03_16820 [Myxococcota bacterium]|nr:hypothetical protein [Myxococcota bacterium]